MYHKILVALENGPADATLLPHISALAKQLRSELVLLHVADGFAARNFDQLKLSESEEMKADRQYLETAAEKLRADGLKVSTHLALGDPPRGILKTAAAENCDLIAMASHGHRFVGDMIYGSTIHKVRHETAIPILLVRASKKTT